MLGRRLALLGLRLLLCCSLTAGDDGSQTCSIEGEFLQKCRGAQGPAQLLSCPFPLPCLP